MPIRGGYEAVTGSVMHVRAAGDALIQSEVLTESFAHQGILEEYIYEFVVCDIFKVLS